MSLVTVLLQGLSEPLGALIALLFVKPFLTPLLLQYMLAFVGGIMVRHAQQTRIFPETALKIAPQSSTLKEKRVSRLLSSLCFYQSLHALHQRAGSCFSLAAAGPSRLQHWRR